jgi:hypothetical protein
LLMKTGAFKLWYTHLLHASVLELTWFTCAVRPTKFYELNRDFHSMFQPHTVSHICVYREDAPFCFEGSGTSGYEGQTLKIWIFNGKGELPWA